MTFYQNNLTCKPFVAVDSHVFLSHWLNLLRLFYLCTLSLSGFRFIVTFTDLCVKSFQLVLYFDCGITKKLSLAVLLGIRAISFLQGKNRIYNIISQFWPFQGRPEWKVCTKRKIKSHALKTGRKLARRKFTNNQGSIFCNSVLICISNQARCQSRRLTSLVSSVWLTPPSDKQVVSVTSKFEII
jgi:hypothetical protein